MTVRVDAQSRAWLDRTARKRRTSRSDVLRELIDAERDRHRIAFETEACRQSRLVAPGAADADAQQWVESVADLDDWR